jgi:hypothetical protein
MKEDILKYENRDNLYKFLIDDFGFVKQEEQYSAESFGNFYKELSSDKFLIRYINDRSFLTIEIASFFAPSDWYDLSFIENYIYHPDEINPDQPELDNAKRIEGLNMFLKRDFGLISNLYNRENYKNTLENIGGLLRKRFEERFPGSIK